MVAGSLVEVSKYALTISGKMDTDNCNKLLKQMSCFQISLEVFPPFKDPKYEQGGVVGEEEEGGEEGFYDEFAEQDQH